MATILLLVHVIQMLCVIWYWLFVVRSILILSSNWKLLTMWGNPGNLWIDVFFVVVYIEIIIIFLLIFIVTGTNKNNKKTHTHTQTHIFITHTHTHTHTHTKKITVFCLYAFCKWLVQWEVMGVGGGGCIVGSGEGGGCGGPTTPTLSTPH